LLVLLSVTKFLSFLTYLLHDVSVCKTQFSICQPSQDKVGVAQKLLELKLTDIATIERRK
jgi:hypothetical protein